jgi:hypothetical protein
MERYVIRVAPTRRKRKTLEDAELLPRCVFIASGEGGSVPSINCVGFVELIGSWIASDLSEFGYASWMSRRKTPQVSFDVGSTVPCRSPVRCPASALRFRAGDAAEFCDLRFLCKENLGLGSEVKKGLSGGRPAKRAKSSRSS